MSRMPRVVLPGVAHHITQRGVRRSNVFLENADRHLYLDLFLENCHRFLLHVLAYCLMTNHVHFVAIPERRDSIWKTFHRCHSVYATKFNMKYEFSGHLWQGRPFSCVLDEAHLWAAALYVERNPVQRIREDTLTGRPCGDPEFVRHVEQALGRDLSPKKPGPKPKETDLQPDPTLWPNDEI